MKTSIIIPCFNEKGTIAEAIEQAKQIKIDKEIIIIDNCSTDKTLLMKNESGKRN